MGSDLSVVNAARVSFAKRHTTFDNKNDTKLINYLAKHNHWSPFGHASMQFYIKAPVFVARQLVKHQVGLVWNEASRRYIDEEVKFYEPKEWRGKPKNSKQGSSDEVININPSTGSGKSMVNDYQQALHSAKWAYEQLLRIGVAPEQARIVLPQSMYTEWYWTGSLIAFERVCRLRMSDDAQQESREITTMVHKELNKLWPISMGALWNSKNI